MPRKESIDRSVIGVCPECGSDIPAGRTLISYQRRGEKAYYADCGACRTVVHPE